MNYQQQALKVAKREAAIVQVSYPWCQCVIIFIIVIQSDEASQALLRFKDRTFMMSKQKKILQISDHKANKNQYRCRILSNKKEDK